MKMGKGMELPLHWGKAPRWLMQKMTRLSREIAIIFIEQFGTEEFLRRLSDPFWFQCFGCVLGFDWHSSGVTSTVLGALKEGLLREQDDLGFYVCGGKGKSSRKTPREIEEISSIPEEKKKEFIRLSRIIAKIDNNALQDGFTLYHHTFLFDRKGNWAVIQQGMNPGVRLARRYHWLGEEVMNLVNEPHKAICCDWRTQPLNLVAQESEPTRLLLPQLAREHPDRLIQQVKKLQTYALPSRHHILLSDIHPDRMYTILQKVYEAVPADFLSLIGLEGVGGKTLRALTLIAELIYGSPVSYRDPARFSFAHGGKDGHPYPVNRKEYDRTIESLKILIDKARVEDHEKFRALRSLHHFIQSLSSAGETF
ncbi:MAG: DUF763 domain-containing protein [bacterium JZ-2024 1]